MLTQKFFILTPVQYNNCIGWTKERGFIVPIIRPRLNDHHGLAFTQEEVSFAIPFVNEDIPLYVDPFLLWKSPSQQDSALHASIVNSFNYLGMLYQDDEEKAVSILKEISECDEVGLGNSKTKQGKKIGDKLAREVLQTFKDIPQLQKQGYTHFEQVQLLVENFSKDRISDITCSLMKSHLIDYTMQKCTEHSIPTQEVEITVFNLKKHDFEVEKAELPVHPITHAPILLVPKRWLRFTPWLNIDDYFTNYISTAEKIARGEQIARIEILEFNRKNFDAIQTYTKTKQSEANACKNDPLFMQIPVASTKRKLSTILKLPTGNKNKADRAYEDTISPMLASMLYPELDFATVQARTASGVLIRDIIFYNNQSHEFLKELYDAYGSRQLVFELKNVEELEREHINQLNRYMTDEMGRFGILFTRSIPPKRIFRNTIDLWSGQRKCILILDDRDLELMCQLYESKQRRPIDVIKKKFVEFKTACPS